MPFTGHVTPLSAVAAALVARGHEVRFYTGSAFGSKVEGAGAALVPWSTAPDFDENDLPATFPRLIGKRGFSQLMINMEDCFIATAPAQVDDLTREWDRQPWDVIVTEEMSVGAALWAERTGCRQATVAVLPLSLAGTQGPPSGIGLTPGRNVVTKARDAALRAAVPLFSRALRAPLARAREGAGLAPSSKDFATTTFSPELVIASGGPLLDFERTDRPSYLSFVGRLAADGAAGSLPDWWGDLDDRTVVHVTQGTHNIDPADLIRPAIDALAERDVLVVVATGVAGRDSLPFPVPDNVRVAGFLPYGALLPRVDVMITNGGWGGTLAALSHGIPLLIAGGDLDKPEIAARVAWAGAGVNLKTGGPSATKVGEGFDRLMAETSYRDAAARVGEQLNSLGGAARAAELLESLL